MNYFAQVWFCICACFQLSSPL